MIDKFNPYATLWPWIRETPLHPENNRDDAEDAGTPSASPATSSTVAR